MQRALILLAASLAAACATSGLPGKPPPSGIARFADDPRLGEPVRRICFASEIDGFSMNRHNVVLLHEGRDRFLVEVYGTCPDLEYAEMIGLAAPTGCLTKGDSLIVTHAIGGNPFSPRRCAIKDIRAWNPDAAPAAVKSEDAG